MKPGWPIVFAVIGIGLFPPMLATPTALGQDQEFAGCPHHRRRSAAGPATRRGSAHPDTHSVSTGPAPFPAPLSSVPPAGNIDIRQTRIRAENPAGLEVEILPDLELSAGTKVSVRVATKKRGSHPGRCRPDGQTDPIYPNRHMLERRDNPEGLNLTKAGQLVTIPKWANPYAGFEFVASPPMGVAMLVAILSDRPVHLVDLPDIPPPAIGQAASISSCRLRGACGSRVVME